MPKQLRSAASATDWTTQAPIPAAAQKTERGACAAARRAFDEARQLIHSLQTRLADAELVAEQTIAAERRARAEAETALQRNRQSTCSSIEGP